MARSELPRTILLLDALLFSYDPYARVGHSLEFQMTYPAAYFSDERVTIEEQIENFWGRWHPSSKLRRFTHTDEKRRLSKSDLAIMAILIPSLVAEVAPLFFLWDSHLPVWQMSGLMALSWAFTWWLTGIVAFAVDLAAQSTPSCHATCSQTRP
jgi:hypothetical protein